MLNTAGLSLDQAPPIRVPFAFFLAAPPFLVLAAALLLWHGEGVLLSRWSPSALALTHLVVLGFLTQVMCGALFQMLPVLAGARVPGATRLAPLIQGLLLTGTLALTAGFLWGGAFWLLLGGGALVLGLLVFMTAAGFALLRAPGVARTARAMRLALLALFMTVLFGGLLLGALLGMRLEGFAYWVDLHLAWGLLGWVGMLILGVGYQVVPMFHVTPAYPKWLTGMGAPLVLLGLLVASALMLSGRPTAAVWGFAVSVLALVVFAAVTLSLQGRRERPRRDATLFYWWSAMLSTILAAGLWALGGRAELIGVLLLVGVGVGLPSGMLLKIMPFLSWFHLQHRQVASRRFDVRLPHMGGFIPERLARMQLGMHLAALSLLATAAAWPELGWGVWIARAGGLLLMGSAAGFWWLQIQCCRTYLSFSRRLD
jgi:hypothetical protein